MENPLPRIELTDPKALRAYAHPTRLRLVALLRREGPLTATQAGERIGESPASASFHLRQLAKYGFVEEAGGGRGRERPWRSSAAITSWANVGDTPEFSAASDLLSRVIVERYFEQALTWLDAKADEPREWQEAAALGDMGFYATAEELAEVGRDVQALLEERLGRLGDPTVRRPGTRLVNVVYLGFPVEPLLDE
jgi:DNA-binding transcriptional ArsR family regulator